jgi:hypothetical protein
MTELREIKQPCGGTAKAKRQSVHSEHNPQVRKTKPVRFELQWRAGPSLAVTISNFVIMLEMHERRLGLRKIGRGLRDTANFHLTAELIVLNLLAVSIAAPDRPLAIPLSNTASRLAPVFGKAARRVVNLMIELGLVTKTQGYPYIGPSTISATERLREYLPLGAVLWSEFRFDEDRPLIVLNTSQMNESDDINVTDVHPDQQSDETKRWLAEIAEEMRTINEAGLRAPITCNGSAAAHISEHPARPMASIVTPHHRTLRRVFTNTWRQNGRLVGAWWQTMPRLERFKQIRIAGEQIAIVDWCQLHPRLSYAEAGLLPPPGDLYAIAEDEMRQPNWPRLRAARKKLVSALLFRNAPLNQWAGADFDEISEMRNAFPPGTTPREAISAIKAKHAAIEDWFEHGHGLRFLRQESDLIVAVTLDLIQQNVVACSVHDAIITARSSAHIVKAVMERVARQMTGAEIPVEIKLDAD